MYNAHFGFAESPFNVTPDSRFFFVNPCYEEAFATLRYGIDARKGFVVVTGQPGTGKTTLLKRLTCSLDSNVQAACVFDPHLSFIELLRLTLGELGLANSGDDRLTMMAQLYDHLVGQLEGGQIVCLMIDEAQNLSVEMLEELRLLSNLETDTEKLIQIILVGQPEFEGKLDRAELIQLKQRVALRCRLQPLQPHEVGLYIASRLKTVRYPRPDLFDGESIERIAHYSNGIPRLINAICDNALLIAYINNRGYIAAGDIDEAAHELQLAPPAPPVQQAPSKPPAHDSTAKPAPEHFLPRAGDRATADSKPAWSPPPRPEFEPLSERWERPPARRQPQASYARSVGLFVILFMMAGTMLFLAVEQKPMPLAAMRAYVEKLANLNRNNSAARSAPALDNQPPQAQTTARAPAPMEMPEPEPAPAPANPPDDPTPQSLQEDFSAAPDGAENKSAAAPFERREKPSSNRPTEINVNKRAVFKSPAGVRVASDEMIAGKKLEIEIYKAIRDRAITGVQVASISDGTVYLDGRVATPRQKLAAVRAALSVPGVRNVRDQITIDY